jgi:hypothetical protein
MAVEEAPEHGNRKALAAILDQALLDLEQRDVRRATDQAEQIVTLRLDTAGPAIAPRRRRRNLPRGLVTRHPAHRACDAHTETPGGRIARQPAQNDRLHHPLAKIIGKRHSRRLLPAAGIINQNSTDSGIPQSIQSARIPL